MMDVFKFMRGELETVLSELKQETVIARDADIARATLEPPRNCAHGDMATNAAMVLAKSSAMKPYDLAKKISVKLSGSCYVTSAEIAGPGFINLRLDNRVWFDSLVGIILAGTRFGDSDLGQGSAVNVEYVSANPTGPLHIGHARGAVFGDVLASLLQKAGYKVTREYYVNDAGSQVDILGRSAYLRYREALGEPIGDIPEGLYPGAYLVPVGEGLREIHGDTLLNMAEADWLPLTRAYALAAMLELIRNDLAELGIHQEIFTSERALVEAGRVDEVLHSLQQRGLIYRGILEAPKGQREDDWEAREQELFKASEFGDDVDRPLRKSDGSWTYFASDIANHLDKFQRGFPMQINVWGADHSGYVKRMQSATTAISEGQARLEVKICQMVKLMDNGVPMKMSKRSGKFVTLRDLIDAVGKDVVRFFLLTRKNDAPMDFDLTTVKEQSRDNPVFYVQYAHARCFSVLRQAKDAFPDLDFSEAALVKADLTCLTDEAEIALIKLMAGWPRLVNAAAEAQEPHRVAFYLQELAAGFHGLWTKGKTDPCLRFVLEDARDKTLARMALIVGVKTVIASGLQVFGVDPVKELS